MSDRFNSPPKTIIRSDCIKKDYEALFELIGKEVLFN